MSHGQHTKTTKLFWCVKHNWRETAGHLGVQTNLDTCLNLKEK